MNKGISVLIFAAGAAIGSLVTWKLTKTKYEAIANEEIKSVKETWAKRNSKNDISKESDTDETDDEEDDSECEVSEDMDKYKELVTGNGYFSEDELEVRMRKGPYVIPPDELGEEDDYEIETLYYFEDKVLTDDFFNPIEDVEGMVGKASLETFGQYEDDSVYVRNDRYKIYFEILADLRKYSEVESK